MHIDFPEYGHKKPWPPSGLLSRRHGVAHGLALEGKKLMVVGIDPLLQQFDSHPARFDRRARAT
jgi:hypothetical protein